MKIALIILAVLLMLLAALLLFPVRLEAVYDRDGVSGEMSLTVKYLFFKFSPGKKSGEKKDRPPKKEKPKAEKEKQPFSFEREKARLERYIGLFGELKDDTADILDYAARRAVVIDFAGVDITFGFGDAMYTGIFTGLLNGFVYSVLGFIHRHSTLRDMKVMITPDFDKSCFKSHFKCIVRLKNVHIIVIVINALKIIRKMKKYEGSR